MNRLFGTHEQYTWLIEQNTPYNVQVSFTVVGDLLEQHVKQGLAALQKMHPLLRSGIDIKVPRFITIDKPIGCIVYKNKTDKERKEIMRQELTTTTIKPETIPMRVVWFVNAKKHHFTFTINHMICDGISAALMVRDFLKFCAMAMDGKPIKVSSFPARPPFESLITGKKQPLKIIINNDKYVAQNSHPIYSKFLHYKFSVEQTKKIRTQIKLQKTTLQGFLGAALILAFAKLLHEEGSDVENITTMAPTNIRPYLSEKLAPNELANFITGTFVDCDPKESLWDLARHIIQAGKKSVKERKYVQQILNGADFLTQNDTPAKIYAFLRSIFIPPITAVSNLGVVPIPKKIGKLHVKEFSGEANLASLWDDANAFSSITCIVFNQLHFSLMFTHPTVSLTRMKKVQKYLLKIIEEIGEADPLSANL